MARRNTPAGLVAVGFQALSLSNSTASGLNTTCATGKFFHVSVETQDARYRGDGTNPALTTGVLLKKDLEHWIMDVAGSQIKFQRTTGTTKISVMAYKYDGE